MTTQTSQREQLRQQRQQRERKQRLTFFGIIIGIALFFLAIIFLPQLLKDTKSDETQSGFSLGDPNAPVKVEEFSDFRCSYCKAFSQNTEPDFIKNYIDTGKVYFTFVNYAFLAEDSVDAAEATYCAADQNAFWQYKETLFSNNTSQDAFTAENLTKYANQLNLDVSAFTNCLDNDTHLADVDNDLAYGKSIGVSATPSFNVNGTVVLSDTLIQTIEEALTAAN